MLRPLLVLEVPDRLDRQHALHRHAFLGERSCAFVIPRAPGLNARVLRQFVQGLGVAAYKLPDRIELCSALPKTAVGKIDKRALREAAAARAQNQESCT